MNSPPDEIFNWKATPMFPFLVLVYSSQTDSQDCLYSNKFHGRAQTKRCLSESGIGYNAGNFSKSITCSHGKRNSRSLTTLTDSSTFAMSDYDKWSQAWLWKVVCRFQKSSIIDSSISFHGLIFFLITWRLLARWSFYFSGWLTAFPGALLEVACHRLARSCTSPQGVAQIWQNLQLSSQVYHHLSCAGHTDLWGPWPGIEVGVD